MAPKIAETETATVEVTDDGPREAILPDGAMVKLAADGASANLGLVRREFKSGSIGYHAQGKLDGADGRRYQVGVTVVLIGSKPE